MSGNKNIWLTFDYELFLYQSGTPEKCLFEPTKRLITLFKKHNVKATFFVDILYYYRLIQLPEQDEIQKKYVSQIQELIEHGHSIELHLHPHWIDAKYENGTWNLTNLSNYKLDALSDEKVMELFDIGTELLEQICRPIKPDYKVTAYRAGGLCILPFEKILPAFIKHNIKIDSSIASGFISHAKNHGYDYSQILLKNPYLFNISPLKKESKGKFLEIPLHWFTIDFWDKLQLKFSPKKLQQVVFGDGKGISLEKKNNSKLLSIIQKFTKLKFYFSFDYTDVNHKIFMKKVLTCDNNLITIMSHPKLMSEKSINNLEAFLKDDRISFLSLEEIYNSFS